jgi:RNA-binding protein
MSDTPAEGRDAAPAPQLSSAERRTLRARAHDIDPVVMVGDAGLSDAVVAETDRALLAHGLIKVRVFGDDRDARQTMAAALEQRLGAALVQAIGKLIVLWRPRPEDTGVEGTPAKPRATPRRKMLTVPKKLAAEGKQPTQRRARPGVPREAEPAAAPRRRTGPPAHRAGPGMRTGTARGALDPSVARAVSGGASSGARPARGAGARDVDSPPRRSGSTGGRVAPAEGRAPLSSVRGQSSARPPASGGRPGTGSRGPGAGARGPSDGARGPGAGARVPASGARGPASGARGPGAGSRGPESGSRGPGAGFGGPASGSRAPTSGGQPPASGARGPASGARGAPPSGAARRTAGKPSSARPPGPASRSGSTPATGSGRPAPRTRGGRRGP